MNLTQKEKDNLLNLYKEDFANFFNVSFDGENYKFNINKSLYLTGFESMAPSFYHNYEIKERDTWTIISYREYNTIELWWLLCRTNQIWDPTRPLIPGTVIKILNKDVADEITALINNENNTIQ